MSDEICQRCNEHGEDRRTLWMACFYEMMELGIPLDRDRVFNTSDPRDDGFPIYTLRVCKNCRADWMTAIQQWFKSQPSKESCGSGIFVRDNGANREISEYEFRMRYPGIEPARFKEE